MARKKEIIGVCGLCGTSGPLSKEHVPPKNAFNKEAVIQYSIEDRITKANPKGKKIQGGIREHSLCELCNRNTGNWYGREYTDWAKVFHPLISSWDRLCIPSSTITLHNVYPLRFLKQVVTCFFSDNSRYGPGFLQANQPLAHFVLVKEDSNLPAGYRFFINLYRRSPMTALRRYPLGTRISASLDRSRGQFRVHGVYVFTEIAHPPFQLLMTVDNLDYPDATEITSFKEYQYDQRVDDFPIKMKITDSSSPYPGAG